MIIDSYPVALSNPVAPGKLYLLKKLKLKIPSPYNRLMPYMIVPGAYKFAEFMKNVFDAVEHSIIPLRKGVIIHGE